MKFKLRFTRLICALFRHGHYELVERNVDLDNHTESITTRCQICGKVKRKIQKWSHLVEHNTNPKS